MTGSTSSNQNAVDGSVADGCLTGLDVHERLVSDPHEDPLLHADLWKTRRQVHGCSAVHVHTIFLVFLFFFLHLCCAPPAPTGSAPGPWSRPP